MLLAATACGKDAGSRAASDSTGRDVELAPSPGGAALDDRGRSANASRSGGTARNNDAPRAAGPLSLAAGTSLRVATTREINSRSSKPGETLRATVGAPVRDASGRTVIPAGSVVTFAIADIHESENKGDKTGRLRLTPSSVTIGGRQYPIDGSVGALPTTLRGRKTNAGDVAKVGVGAGAGAVVGGVLGGGKGAVIGGVLGGAVGTQRAVETKDRDVVLPAGAQVTVTLRGPLTVGR
jgi:hypothetical protein